MSFNTKAGMRDDMTMTNMTDSQPALDNKNATIVLYFSTVHTTITCPTNYVAFPFDQHICKIMFTSYTQTNNTLIVTSAGVSSNGCAKEPTMQCQETMTWK